MPSSRQTSVVRQLQVVRPAEQTLDLNSVSSDLEASSPVPSALAPTPAQVIARQRAVGNQAVQRSLIPVLRRPISPLLFGAPIQRYESYEHAQAGDHAAGSVKLKIQGIEMTSGEINALGDLYGSPDEIKKADPAELQQVVDLIRKQKADPSKVGEADWDRVTNGRYTKLNLKNSIHFGPQNAAFIAPQPSTPAGGDNRTVWHNYHTQALGFAKQAALAPDDATRKKFLDDAYLFNSYGEHFLVDAFSAGHLFNKDDTIATIEKNLGALKPKELETLFSNIATRVFTVHGKLLSKYEMDAPGPWWPNIDSAGRFQALLNAMYEKPEGRAGVNSAIVKAAHDHLNTQKDSVGNIGVAVENDFEQWFLSGDKTLSSSANTQKWLDKALEQSRNNIRDASMPVSIAPDAELMKHVEAFLPRATSASTKDIHDLLERVTDPKAGMVDAIAGVLTSEIQALLDALLQRGYIRKA